MNKGTKIRTVVLFVAVVNQAISQVGDPDFGNETANLVYRIISYIFTVAAAVICTRLAGQKADNWWLRHHEKVLNLPFKEGSQPSVQRGYRPRRPR